MERGSFTPLVLTIGTAADVPLRRGELAASCKQLASVVEELLVVGCEFLLLVLVVPVPVPALAPAISPVLEPVHLPLSEPVSKQLFLASAVVFILLLPA